MKTFDDFLRWEEISRDSIDVKRIYVDIAGDLVTGILLSQIIYWHLPSSNGQSKLTVIRDGKEWLAKKRSDWWDECRISPKQFDRSIGILQRLGLVEVKTFKFDGCPTKHIHLNKQVLLEGVNSIFTKGEFPTSPKGKMEVDQRGSSHPLYITKTTSQKNTAKSSFAPKSPQSDFTLSEKNEQKTALEVAHGNQETKSKIIPSTTSNQEKIREPEIVSSFNIFWKAYPKKRNKGQAEKAFKKLDPDPQLLERILSKLELFKRSEDWRREKGKYIPYPATWLNARGWEDEIEAEVTPLRPEEELRPRTISEAERLEDRQLDWVLDNLSPEEFDEWYDQQMTRRKR